MIDHEAEKIITAELGPSEKLIWASRPQKFPLTLYASIHLLLALTGCAVFIHLFFDLFLLNPEWRGGEIAPGSIILLPVIFILFFVIILVNTLRVFIAPNKQVYGLTQNRGIVVTTLRKKHVISIGKNELSCRTRRGGDIIGTLTFRVAIGSHDIYRGLLHSDQGISFYNISNPREVEHLIETKTLKESAL